MVHPVNQDSQDVESTSAVETRAEVLRHAIAQAVHAPSQHNAQPWRFAVRGATVEMFADRSRALPVVDPDGRELLIGCGAALFHLRTALRAASLDVDVYRLPDPADADLLARVVVRSGAPPTDDERALAEAIPWRHVVRTPFLGLTLPDDLVEMFCREAATEGAWLAPLSDEGARIALVALVMDADHQQWADPAFRREAASWMRPNDSAARDGVFGFTDGLDNVESHLAPIAARLMNLGAGRALRDRDLADGSPLLMVLGTDGDSARDWLRAGEALDRVLLRAESEDVAVGFLNQPVELPDLRARVRELAGRTGHAQMVLRLGFGPDGRETPRRDVDDVLV